MCFRFPLCIPSYSDRSNGVAFLIIFFVRLTVLPLQGFEVTHPIFEILITMGRRLPHVFYHLVPNDNSHCQRLLRNAKFDYLAVKMPVG